MVTVGSLGNQNAVEDASLYLLSFLGWWTVTRKAEGYS